jgi:hypothetical protein
MGGDTQEEDEKEKEKVAYVKCGEVGHYTNKSPDVEDKMTNLMWETSAYVTYHACSRKGIRFFSQVLLDNQSNI